MSWKECVSSANSPDIYTFKLRKLEFTSHILKSLKVIPQLCKTFRRELIPYDLRLVVLHAKSMISFPLASLEVVCGFE